MRLGVGEIWHTSDGQWFTAADKAEEHTEDSVLKLMAKPSFTLFERLRVEFDRIVASSGRKCELVPYFISGHPGCGMREMQRLAR